MSKHGSGADEEAPVNDRAFSEDGVDLTLIRWMLSLSPVHARSPENLSRLASALGPWVPVEFEIEADVHIRVLSLSALISLKVATGREKDLAMLPTRRREARLGAGT